MYGMLIFVSGEGRGKINQVQWNVRVMNATRTRSIDPRVHDWFVISNNFRVENTSVISSSISQGVGN